MPGYSKYHHRRRALVDRDTYQYGQITGLVYGPPFAHLLLNLIARDLKSDSKNTPLKKGVIVDRRWLHILQTALAAFTRRSGLVDLLAIQLKPCA